MKRWNKTCFTFQKCFISTEPADVNHHAPPQLIQQQTKMIPNTLAPPPRCNHDNRGCRLRTCWSVVYKHTAAHATKTWIIVSILSANVRLRETCFSPTQQIWQKKLPRWDYFCKFSSSKWWQFIKSCCRLQFKVSWSLVAWSFHVNAARFEENCRIFFSPWWRCFSRRNIFFTYPPFFRALN